MMHFGAGPPGAGGMMHFHPPGGGPVMHLPMPPFGPFGPGGHYSDEDGSVYDDDEYDGHEYDDEYDGEGAYSDW